MFQTIITPSELVNYKGKCTIIDCRFYLSDKNQGYQEYLEGHIPNAVYAHLDDDLSGEIIKGKTGRHPLPSVDKAIHLFSQFGIDEHTQVVAYCSFGGGIAARVWWMLKWLGHENVAVLDGGWQNWIANDFPVSKEIVKPKSTNFKPKVNPNVVVDFVILEEATANPQHIIVDSRTAPRYRGEHEPIDPVAGHIPSAVNYPWVENLNEQKQFLAKETLQERFKELLSTDKVLTFYCGSGVTACHNILTLEYLGYKGAKLYPGSWSEWIVKKEL